MCLTANIWKYKVTNFLPLSFFLFPFLLFFPRNPPPADLSPQFLHHGTSICIQEKNKDKDKRFRPLYDIPYMFEAREFLRKKLIGKKVRTTERLTKRSVFVLPCVYLSMWISTISSNHLPWIKE